MSSHVVVFATPRVGAEENARKYSEGVQPLLAAAGIKPSFRGPVVEVVAGGPAPKTVMVLDFPDAASASASFRQEAYQQLVALRGKGFEQMEIYIVE
ncbi:hypothetical protein BTR14_19055 [Rhizobium rhizosphaerae]|uniref:DUF1330 domain-containing protein n=1 Tax=Xaviernesmea rhizosphaerae TaxID=1672749 RepID=A0ABX3P8D1_9HYPH|nr:DUF1330 domain-containing protein [Xaviernesmea rhizosphaerae]OQP84478.1 hypothetical protein BTR14_19055 [Xaviernesmea rhizosphaerae]